MLAFAASLVDKAVVREAVLTLIAGTGAPAIETAMTAAAGKALGYLGARVGETRWLAAGRACDILFTGLDPDQADAGARQALAGQAIDIVAQPSAGRRKRLLVADMEATIIANEMLEELADFLGLRAPVAEITQRAMNGEIDFAAALTQRVALLKGMPAAILDEAAARIRITPGAAALVATMRAAGARAALVSGGFTVFAAPVARRLGFDDYRANTLIVENGRILGDVALPILDRDAKLSALKELAAAYGLSLAEAAAVGDGANDLPMIEAAGLGIAFRAKPAVAARARTRIDHADLTALLYAQGYREEEIRTGVS